MTQWPHAPIHKLSSKGIYIVTGATYQKTLLFQSPDQLNFLQNTLLALACEYHWKLQAWAIFSNHYHFIAESPDNPKTLTSLISQLHTVTARSVNSQDRTPNRKVWWNYWETRLSYPHSYYARLNYVNQNAVKHGLVTNAVDYPWCSASWFARVAPVTFQNTVNGFKMDSITIVDDF